MNYTNFLRLLLCFVLHISILYSSEREETSESWCKRLWTRTNSPLTKKDAYSDYYGQDEFYKARTIIKNQQPEANFFDENSHIINQRGIGGYSSTRTNVSSS